MDIPRDYLLDEVRCGYYIPAMMKKTWANALEILGEIDRVCTKYNIKYFADWGTFLGTVRHGGYIPWDDDMDICMKREDYRKFCEVWRRELPDSYFMENFHENPDHDLFLGTITSNKHICFEEDYLRTHHSFPYRSGVDIFVLDYLPRDEKKKEEIKEKCLWLISVGDMLYDKYETKGIEPSNYQITAEDENVITDSERRGGFKVDRKKRLRQQFYIRAEEIMASTKRDDADEMVQMFPWGLKGRKGFPKEMYDESVRLPFEFTEMPVPLCYDKMLKHRYGNYMQYNRNYGAHDYPFYESQRKDFKLLTGADVPDFFDPVMPYDKKYISPRDMILPKNRKEDGRKTVIFLPCRDIYWDSMAPFYEKEKADENSDVYVIPLALYVKEMGYDIKDVIYDIDYYPEDLELYDFNQVDISSLNADVIYIQYPYDSYHASVTVSPDYYAENLRQYTDKLVYVPYFEIKDFPAGKDSNEYFCMRHFVTVPGVVLSDEIYVESEEIKNRYIEKLTDWAGGDDIASVHNIRVRAPKEKAKSKNEKRVLFRNTISSLAEFGLEDIDKIKRVLETFREQKEVKLSWAPQELMSDIERFAGEKVTDEYKKVVEKYINEGWGEFIENDEMLIPKLVDYSYFDAYYGDASEVATWFKEEKKPVMLMDVKI